MLPDKEREYLRQLAEEVRKCSVSEVNLERRERWYCHNRGEIVMPPIIAETFGVDHLLIGELKCESETGKSFEFALQRELTNYHRIDDDKVLEAEFVIPMNIQFCLFGIDINELRQYETDDKLAYSINHPFKDLENDLKNLQPSYYQYDKAGTEQLRDAAEECFGDILQVKVQNYLWNWKMGLTEWAVALMGMEQLFFAYMDSPELTDFMLQRMVDDLVRTLGEQQEAGLLTLNNGNHYVGSGSRGFTEDLPGVDFAGQVRTCDLWGNFNSQESVGVDPDFYMEHIYPYYETIAQHFGKTYYGCCEDVSILYDAGLKNFPGLSKISISPWCNEKVMADKLRGGKIIYSRKPSPNFIGTAPFDSGEYRRHITATLENTADCPLEFILRDIYELGNDHTKITQAVQVIRDVCTNYYNK